MKNTFIGAPMERREDLRFLRGRGNYVDDLAPANLLYAVILRSSVAHGRIRSIDASRRAGDRGRARVITAKDMPGGPPIIPMRLQPLPEFKPFEQPVIAHDKVRYVGEPLAVVLAASVAIGEDALEQSRSRSTTCRRSPTGTWRRRTRACCSRRRAPTARSSSTPARATPTRRSPRRPMSGAKRSAPGGTTGSPWSRAA